MRPALLRRLFCLLAFTVASTAFAQVTLTLTYLPTESRSGFVAGVPATWTVTIDSEALGSYEPESGAMGWSNAVTSFSGTLFTPGVSRVAGSSLGIEPETLTISFYIGFDRPARLGDGPVYYIYGAVQPVANWSLPQLGDVSLGSYVSDYLVGTYSVGDFPNYIDTGGLPAGAFTSVTIANLTAVPEPSTYAALAGLGALAFAAWCRRRTAA